MLTREEIERRKKYLAQHPETKKVCALLGVTLERFLEDIEVQATEGVLYSSLSLEESGRSVARVREAALESCFEVALEAEQRAGRRDSFDAPTAAEREQQSRWLAGA